jgi:alanine-synthesizing transaminase
MTVSPGPPQDCVAEICAMYKERRDVLCDGLNSIGWNVEKPKATMFVWAPIPAAYKEMGSIEFSKKMITHRQYLNLKRQLLLASNQNS